MKRITRTPWAALAMALLTTTAAAMPDTTVLPACRWSEKIGAQRYIGTVEDALARMSTALTRDQIDHLRVHVNAGRPTTGVTMRRDSLQADDPAIALLPGIAMMHFGTKSLCMAVRRDGWRPSFSARADLYAIPGSDLALLVPHDCGNFALVKLSAPYAPAVDVRATFADRIRSAFGRGSDPAVAPGPRPPFDDGVRRALEGHPVPWPHAGPDLGFSGPARGGGGEGGGAPAKGDGQPASNHVPEPGGLILAGVALVAALGLTKRAKRC